LSATDLAAAERFYCRGLGLKKAFDFIRNGRVVGFYFEAGRGGYIEVFQQDGVDPDANGAIRHFCLEVGDIKQAGLRLAKNGYAATRKTLGADRSWQMWTADPSGVRIELHQYTKASSQVTHKDCVLK